MAIEEQKWEVSIYSNRLDWWKNNSTDLPLLLVLSWCLFSIPAKQTQSEQMYSSAGQILAETLNRLNLDNL